MNLNNPTELPYEVDVKTVQQLLESEAEFLLLDCREPQEHQFVRIDGATLIPLSQMMERAAELDPHKNDHIVVMCHHGGRSWEVTQWLRQRGFSRTQNMAGGIDAWSREIDPSLPRY